MTPTPPPAQKTIDPKNIKTMEEAYAFFIEVYRNRPVEFVEDVLKAKPLPWQKDFLNAVARGERRISVRAGHGVGKSTACSWALIWFMLTRYPQKSVLTAPTAGQLFDALFSEVKRWINALPEFLKENIEVFSDRIVHKHAPESSFMSARTSSAERPEALAGVHSENVLLICDEASAIPEPVFESAAGSMSGHSATTVLIGNPTRNTGLFFRTHHQLSSDWYTMHVSCLDNPLVAKDFVQQIKTTYGEGSNAFRVRVLGEFSLREDDVLIAAELVDAAMDRDIVLDPKEPIIYGVDVARFGDDRTVICKRQGQIVTEVKSWSGSDLMETVGRIIHEADMDDPTEIMVDSIGLGAGVADRLREQGYNVRDVNVSESAAMNPQAARLRDELWLAVRDWLNQRTCKIPKMDELRQELCAPTYTFASNGKIKVEGKSELKRRGMRSPDIADALCLTFAGGAAFVGGRASRWVSGKPLKRNIAGVV
jgi:phage terminase large subunit